MRLNPFKPNAPVPPGAFVGRLREVDRIEYLLVHTKAGNPGAFLISGERGIGKSSLLLYANAVASGDVKVDGAALRFIVIHTDIDPAITQLGLVRKIEVGLRRTLAANEKARTAFARAWEFLQRVDAGGFTLKERQSGNPIEAVLEEAAYSLADTIKTITSNRLASDFGLSGVYDGVLLLIDEADNASPDLHLGSFLKLLIERVQRAGCSNLCVGLAGLPKVTDILKKSHESSLRLFEELPLGPLNAEDTNMVIDLGLEEANAKNPKPMQIDEDARQALHYFSEGFPHFIQQFAASAFSVDTDWTISSDDVLDGAFDSGGAYELIGNRYYRDAFYNQIKQESYRQVLRIMAAERPGWVKKSTIRAAFKGTDSTLGNAIHALSSRGLILRQPGALGSYRLVHRGFANWIRFFTLDPEAVRRVVRSVAREGSSSDES